MLVLGLESGVRGIFGLDTNALLYSGLKHQIIDIIRAREPTTFLQIVIIIQPLNTI